MDWFVKAFLKASLAWLALGVTLGVAMAAHPAWAVYRTAHLHMLLLGFVTMMIFGVAYHVIPRFTGHPLHARRAPGWHWWIANVGLVLMVVGFLLRPSVGAAATPVLAAGGVLAALGAYTFAYVMWRTIDGPAGLRRAAARAEERARASKSTRLPVAEASASPARETPADVRR
jgi:cbb3-type cytochrome oxidase subunit 1